MEKLKNIAFYAGVLAALLYPASPARSAEEEYVDNPDYAGWAKFKPGDFVKTRVVTLWHDAGDQAATTEETTKLVSVDKDKVVVEITTTKTVDDNVQKQPPVTQTFSAKVPKDSLPEFKDAGAQSVQIGTKDFNCTIRQVLIRTGKDRQEEIGKVWISDKMPGGAVKVEAINTKNICLKVVEGEVVEFKASV
ncbi:MAG: hypothetical protein HZA50_02710 [Planctomycetes bacterium]|nr:hypothetical protein [Planctomycetota bacterium]